MSAHISHVLTSWEADPANRYGEQILDLASAGCATFVVSDLHIGAGLSPDGTYDGLENFFADAGFGRFLDWAHARSDGRAILVINGDFIDFLRIVTLPETESDFEQWSRALAPLGISRDPQSLRPGITKKEVQFGLKTDDYKSVFKLMMVARGHQALFEALAIWLHQGHRLIVTKGNHDLEWYWPAVRNHLRLILAERIVAKGRRPDIAQALTQDVLPRLIFADNGVLLDGDVYLEHGHRYDRYTRVLGKAVLPGGTELNIPFGSFFNRYVINTVELRYPYADKVRPAENLLSLMVREHFFVAMKLLFCHIPFVVRIVPKRYYRYILARVLPLAAAFGLPIVLMAWNLRHAVSSLITAGQSSTLLSKAAQDIGLPVASYFLGRIVAYLQLREPDDLNEPARQLLAREPRYRLVTFGHTHNPTQFLFEKQRFCNTGTWIPVVETSTAEVREDRTYTFLEIRHRTDGGVETASLQRWNDDAGRADQLVVVCPKD